MRNLLVAGALFAFSQSLHAGERAATAPDVRGAVQRGLAFLEKDGLAWKQDRQCASCHHTPMTLWAFNEARKQGYQVNAKTLAELTAWAVDKDDPAKIFPKRKETKEKFVTYSPLIVALGVEAGDTKEAAVRAGLQKMLSTLLPDQREDGSWRLNEGGRPPLAASPEVMTTLAVLALTDTNATVLGEDGKAAAMKAVKWLEETKATDDEVQAIALRLLLRHRLGKSRDDMQPTIKHLLGRQNPDGGWSQATGMTSDAYATGQALYALGKSGMEASAPAVKRAQAFLAKTQMEDGSWPMTSRPMKPGEAGSKKVGPITHAGSAWGVLGLVVTAPEALEGRPAPRFVRAWGKKGTANGEFRVPIGIAIDKDDRVFVSDLRNNRVQQFDADGKFVAAFTVSGQPGGIAVDGGGTIYVSLFDKDRIGAYSREGKPLREWGETGRGAGQFKSPAGLAVGPEGSVYLGDDVNRRIQKFSAEGKFLAMWGKGGTGPGEFGGEGAEKLHPDFRTSGPNFLSFDSKGLLYATDGRGGKVHQFKVDGTVVSAWGNNDDKPGGFGGRPKNLPGPTGIAIDKQDLVWVASTNSRVQLFTAEGKYLVGFGGRGDEEGQFHTPHGLAIDSKGNLYVADTQNNRVQKFSP